MTHAIAGLIMLVLGSGPVLRLIGLPTRALVAFPVTQAVLIALLGLVLGGAVFQGAATVLNTTLRHRAPARRAHLPAAARPPRRGRGGDDGGGAAVGQLGRPAGGPDRGLQGAARWLSAGHRPSGAC